MEEQKNEARPDVDLFQAMEARVRAGEPIYIGGSLEGEQGAMQLRMVARLKAATGKPVHAIFY